jgi:hypothetical protein
MPQLLDVFPLEIAVTEIFLDENSTFFQHVDKLMSQLMWVFGLLNILDYIINQRLDMFQQLIDVILDKRGERVITNLAQIACELANTVIDLDIIRTQNEIVLWILQNLFQANKEGRLHVLEGYILEKLKEQTDFLRVLFFFQIIEDCKNRLCEGLTKWIGVKFDIFSAISMCRVLDQEKKFLDAEQAQLKKHILLSIILDIRFLEDGIFICWEHIEYHSERGDQDQSIIVECLHQHPESLIMVEYILILQD